MTTNPRVAVKGKLHEKTLTFINKCHLFDNTLDSSRLYDLALADRIAKLATDLNTLEVFSKVVTSEHDLARSLRRAVVRHNLLKLNLIIVIELSEVIKVAVKVKSERDVACDKRILCWQNHWALDHVIGNTHWQDVSLV